MKTKYILAGGNDRGSVEYWAKLAAEINNSNPVHVLSCFFSQPRENWESKYPAYNEVFMKAFGKLVTRELAFPHDFRGRVKNADIIYLHGGDDTLLVHYLDGFNDLKDMFAGKTVIGSSAGADYLSRNYWTCDWRDTFSGSGLTPLNIIPHYGSDYGKDDPRGPIDWEAAHRAFKETIGSGQEVVCLREGEFVVFES